MAIPVIPERSGGGAWIGIAWMVVTGLMFVCVTGIVHYVGSAVPAAEAAFIRYGFGVALILPFLIRGLRHPISLATLGVFSLRGLAHALGVILWFYAMANIPMAEVTAIGYTSPIYITIGAAVFFGEKLAMRRIFAVVAGFVGAMIIIRPGFHEVSSGQLAQLLSAPMFAISYLIAKRLTVNASPAVVVGMLSIFVTICLMPFAYAVWQVPSLADTAWLALVAVFATLGHFTMTKALHAAPLTVTQPVTFLQLVWATILGAAMFGEAADFFVLLGGGVIIGSISFISYREWVISRRMHTPPEAATR